MFNFRYIIFLFSQANFRSKGCGSLRPFSLIIRLNELLYVGVILVSRPRSYLQTAKVAIIAWQRSISGQILLTCA